MPILDLLTLAEVPAWIEAGPWWAVIIWVAAFGGCVGSFFNVVLYRVPRGEGVVMRNSHCPVCDHPIRWRHNLPVIGWLLLRGRCYDCGARISARYPIIEAAFALGFVAIAIATPWL